ncbi:UDP-4-amino-4-deoxy-L-arabinose--oxoglutarate aminotransferase [bioreactor metagenome]|uniref:UDP-4-amino-4-deoxy-L-arabinose--oxoglutarate aminotransferase n=1 Tax=bioreactor metagenome TaxID=1076179 RepID=A0A644W7W4_9ZZZZ
MDKLIWPKWPVIDCNSLQYTSSSLMNGRFSISGNEDNSISFIRIAEKKMEQFTKSNYAILTANGSSALLLAMQSLNIGIGDEVILPAMTWVGVASAILRVGAIPVFIDTSSTNPHMDFKEIENKVTQKTKAIIAPHLYSTLINVGLLKIQFPNISIIEDASHCSGLYESILRTNQTEADIIIFSLQATKSLTCGEGGVILVKQKELANKILSLRNDSRSYDNIHSETLELRPGNYHGANLNLSDLQAALLLDQLEKHNEICLQRKKSIKLFQDLTCQDSSLEISFSSELTENGNFYGIPCKLNCDENTFQKRKTDFEKKLNLCFWTPYTPIPHSNLYKPHTVKSYSQSQNQEKGNFPNSFEWIKNRFIIPHQIFLSSEKQIEMLYDTLSEKKKPHISKSNSEGVSVIVLTKNRKEKLVEAINSVLMQDFKGSIEILLIGDNCNYLDCIDRLKLPKNIKIKKNNIILDRYFDEKPTVCRVATLRNISINLVSQNFICFLDDDNQWEENHISSLIDSMNQHNCKATFSWRKLFLENGKPFIPKSWPWIGSDISQDVLSDIYLNLGVLDENSNILKDCFEAIYQNRDYATIDMGAWLFRKEIFDIIKFRTNYSEEEINSVVTEDDVLLKDLKKLNFIVHPSQKATLKYYLGGYSNMFKYEI